MAIAREISIEAVLAVMIRHLSPPLGPTMATAAVRGVATRLAIGAGKPVTAEQVRELLDALRPGLHVYVGRERATELIAAIERDLAKETTR